jgi:transposase
MIYVGLDVSSKSFVVHAVTDRKKIVFKGEIEPSKKALKEMVTMLGKDSKLIAFEAGNQLKWIALYLKKLDCHIHVVHPNTIKWISESSGKTDKIDAKKLAELARGDLLPEKVHIVEGEVRKLRELLSARNQLQSKRVSLINSLRGYMKQEGVSFPAKFFSVKSRRDKIQSLKVAETQKLIIDQFLLAVDKIQESEIRLGQEIAKFENQQTELLETIPGFGKFASRVIVAAVDKVDRFSDRRKIAKYGALTPRLYQSGNTLRHGAVANDGRGEIRKILLQCAHAVMRTKSFTAKPLQDFYWRVEKRAGQKRALIALTRKLLVAAYGVMKSQKAYDPFYHAAKAA